LKFPAFLGNGFIINKFLFSYFILLFKPVISSRDVTHDVVECILLAICNLHVLHVGSVLPYLKTLIRVKCCMRFSVPRDPVMTLSPV